MTAKANREFIQNYLDDFRRDRTKSTLDHYIGEEELKLHIAVSEEALPGYWIEPHDIIAENDKVFVRGTIHGVHKGTLMGIPPTGKTVSVPIYIVYQVFNQKIVGHWKWFSLSIPVNFLFIFW